MCSKHFQLSYKHKKWSESKRIGRLKEEVEGERENACPQTLRFWKTTLDISHFSSFVNMDSLST